MVLYGHYGDLGYLHLTRKILLWAKKPVIYVMTAGVCRVPEIMAADQGRKRTGAIRTSLSMNLIP